MSTADRSQLSAGRSAARSSSRLRCLSQLLGRHRQLVVLAVFGVVRLAISSVTGLMIVYAILSWVQAGSPLYDVIDRLCAPLLRPLRRIIPLVGGLDLSPLALLVLLQVAAILLGNAMGWAWTLGR